MALRCLIVDDSEEFLASAGRLLTVQGLDVVGVATSGEAARRLATRLRPDVALVDVHLGDENGLELARQLAGAVDGMRIVLISTHPEADLAELVEGTPAAGFLAKTALSADSVVDLVGDGS